MTCIVSHICMGSQVYWNRFRCIDRHRIWKITEESESIYSASEVILIQLQPSVCSFIVSESIIGDSLLEPYTNVSSLTTHFSICHSLFRGLGPNQPENYLHTLKKVTYLNLNTSPTNIGNYWLVRNMETCLIDISWMSVGVLKHHSPWVKG